MVSILARHGGVWLNHVYDCICSNYARRLSCVSSVLASVSVVFSMQHPKRACGRIIRNQTRSFMNFVSREHAVDLSRLPVLEQSFCIAVLKHKNPARSVALCSVFINQWRSVQMETSTRTRQPYCKQVIKSNLF
jgi:hypothetical protein